MSNPDVIIIGSGMAGLSCARALHKQGVSFRIFEASDAPGGRVRTDRIDGYQLDRGFQTLLTACPEALEQLDYDGLKLCAFSPGALVRHHGRVFRVTDPWREPGTFLSSLFSPLGKFGDKWRIARLRGELLKRELDDILDAEETTTMQALRRRRFSRRFIEHFFRPLIGGMTLDPKLTVSSRAFEFYFKMLIEGDVAVPAEGMQAIPEQLAAALPPDSIAFNQRIHSIAQKQVKLVTGDVVAGEAVVIATEGPEASRLLGHECTIASRSACCLYFSAKEPPIDEPLLLLGGSSRGPINSLAVMNMVAPGYAPPGENLVSITVLGWPSRDDQTLVNMVRAQLKRWYGLITQEWRLLRLFRISHGQPVVFPLERFQPRLSPGLYICGDHRSTPSLNGAMESGRLAAESLLREMRGEPDPRPEPRAKPKKPERRLKPTDEELEEDDAG